MNAMDLEEFVHTTIVQIINGVVTAQQEAAARGAIVNPTYRRGKFAEFHPASGAVPQSIEFDVAVTATDGAESGAGLRVGIPLVAGSVGGGSTRESTAENRVKFAVPVVLPRQAAKSEG